MNDKYELTKETNVEIYVFSKKSNTTEFMNRYIGQKADIIDYCLGRSHLTFCIVKALRDAKLCYVHNIQCEPGGCTFLLMDHDKAEKFIRDNEWINNIKKAAKEYQHNCGFYYIELQRIFRKDGENEAFRKCLNRINKHYPDFIFVQFPVESDLSSMIENKTIYV